MGGRAWAVLAALAMAAGGCTGGANTPGTSLLEVFPNPLNFQIHINNLNLTISSVAGGLGAWSCQADVGWITLGSDHGTGDGLVKVTVDRSGLTVGEHTAKITVSSNLGDGEVQVKVTVVEGTGLSGEIAFASNRGGKFDIYLMNVTDKSTRKLTTGAGNNLAPSWSPDGKQLAYMSDRSGNFDIYILDVPDSGPPNERHLVASGEDDLYPSWSPDGGKIAFVRSEDNDTALGGKRYYLYTVDPSGAGLAKDTRIDNLYSVVQYPLHVFDKPQYSISDVYIGPVRPAWSPDGKKVIVESYGYVFGQTANSMVEFDLTDVTAPARGIVENQGIGSSYQSWADFSPDGTKLVLAATAVSVLDLNGGIVDPILPADSDWYTAPDWSPDGKHIVYSPIADDNRDIWVVDTFMSPVDGGREYFRTRLTDDPAEDKQAVWRPGS